MIATKRSVFEKDFEAAENSFPKLKYAWNKKFNIWVIFGQLDICDVEGVYWETFDIKLFVPKGYPYCVPLLYEKSDIIHRDIDWHISPNGACCYDIEHNLLVMAKRGIRLATFIAEKIYPYFANQLYKLSEKEYAGSEYAHHLEGVIQYYKETHNLHNEQDIVRLLQHVIGDFGIGRNDKCPCGSGKRVKICHLASIQAIKAIGRTKLREDLDKILANRIPERDVG